MDYLIPRKHALCCLPQHTLLVYFRIKTLIAPSPPSFLNYFQANSNNLLRYSFYKHIRQHDGNMVFVHQTQFWIFQKKVLTLFKNKEHTCVYQIPQLFHLPGQISYLRKKDCNFFYLISKLVWPYQ